jgi:hypothetical protein
MKFTYAVATAHHLMGLASECNKFHSISWQQWQWRC